MFFLCTVIGLWLINFSWIVVVIIIIIVIIVTLWFASFISLKIIIVLLPLKVAVPPSTKALSWLYSQQRSLVVFPQFYLSRKQSAHSSCGLDLINLLPQVSGIGAAICFRGSSHTQRGCNFVARLVFLFVDYIVELIFLVLPHAHFACMYCYSINFWSPL